MGCNNSGTGLLSKLLSMHPAIDYLEGEGQSSPFIPSAAKLGVGRIWTEKTSIIRNPNIDVDAFKKDLLNRRETKVGQYTLEHSPPNTIRIPWLMENFKPAVFIAIIRNGYAVAEGIRRKRKKKKVSVERGAKHWLLSNKIMLEDREKIGGFPLVTYEELTKTPLTILRGLEEYLEITPHNYPLSEPINLGRLQPISKIMNFNEFSFNRLNENDKMGIQKSAQELLDKFKYTCI
ncbi:hypothetical protein ES703_116412 [subsurface metagenome]